nr:hypothetical protein [Sphingomonas insulae]
MVVLAVKLLVPAGFMVGVVDGRVSLQICSGFGPVTAAPMPHHAMAPAAMPDHMSGAHGKADGHPAADMPCPFTALAHGVAMPVDAVLLAVALAFVLALGFAAVRRVMPRTRPFLRPFLRGPPFSA